jgi:hypothetical protein
MSSFQKTSQTWLLLLCVIFLCARVGGAHWHVCLDGSEAPVAAHIGDVGVHHQDHVAEHADVDLRLADSVLAKTFQNSGDLPALLFVLLLLSMAVQHRRVLPPLYRPRFCPVLLHQLTAPPRAPPR